LGLAGITDETVNSSVFIGTVLSLAQPAAFVYKNRMKSEKYDASGLFSTVPIAAKGDPALDGAIRKCALAQA
jgi:hypothetical protein